MSAPQALSAHLPRMLWWLLGTIALMLAAHVARDADPASLLAVTLYKGHLMSLGGWGGYWLDRALFPYARPHVCLEDEPAPLDLQADEAFEQLPLATRDYPLMMLRRAIIVAACLMCVGLGA